MLAGLGGYIYWSNSSGASKTVNLDKENRTTDSRASDPPRDSETLLAAGSREELLDSLTESADQKDGQIAFLNYQRHTRRAELAERLLEMELQPSARYFAARTYLESLSAADWINAKSQLGMKDSRLKMLAAGDKYSEDGDPPIAALANLALTTVPLADFWATKDPKNLDLIKEQFDLRDKQILQNSHTARRFAEAAVELKLAEGFESTTEPLLMHILSRYEQETSPEIVQGTKLFREKVIFGGLDLVSLAERVEFQRPESGEQVEQLFEGLSKHPDVRPRNYQIATATIRSYWKLGQKEDAAALAKRLEEAAKTISDDDTRNAVLAEIDAIHELGVGSGQATGGNEENGG